MWLFYKIFTNTQIYNNTQMILYAREKNKMQEKKHDMLAFLNNDTENGRLELAEHFLIQPSVPFPSPDYSHNTLIYVFKGAISVRVRETTVRLTEGYALIASAGQSVEILDVPADASSACVRFDAQALPFGELRHDEIALRMPEAGFLLQRLLNAAERKNREAAEALLAVILYAVSENKRKIPGAVCQADKVRTYIDEHITEALTAESVSAALHYHPDYLNRVIRNNGGHTLKEYICTERLGYAEQLLAKTGMTNEEIAKTMHFTTTSHFLKFFKYHAGMTPTQYRISLLSQK